MSSQPHTPTSVKDHFDHYNELFKSHQRSVLLLDRKAIKEKLNRIEPQVIKHGYCWYNGEQYFNSHVTDLKNILSAINQHYKSL